MKYDRVVRRKRSEFIQQLKAFASKYAKKINDPDDLALIPFLIKFLEEESELEDLLDKVEMIYRGMR